MIAKVKEILGNKMTGNSRFVLIVGIINFCLAAVALLKDMLLASYLGTSREADAFMLAFFITDMIGNNLIANALGTSTVPVFSKVIVKEDDEELNHNILKINEVILIFTSIICIVIFLNRDLLINFLGNGFSVETKELANKLLLIFLPTIIFYPVLALGISVLQVLGKFIISSLAPVVFNFIFLVGILYCTVFKVPFSTGIYIIAAFVVGAILIMLLMTYVSIPELNALREDLFKFDAAVIKSMSLLFVPYFLILLISQFMLYIERYLASQFPAGSTAALNYAYRLTQFPIWVFVAAISTVLLPSLAKLNQSGKSEIINETLSKAIWYMLIIIIPITILLYLFRIPIISILFLRGAFDSSSLTVTDSIFKGYCLAILGLSIISISLRFFLARGKIYVPAIVFFSVAVINFAFDFLTIKSLGISAIGYGAAISASINALILIRIMNIKFHGKQLLRLIISNIPVVLFGMAGVFLWQYMISYIFLLKVLFLALVFIFIFIIYYGSLKFNRCV